MYLRNRHRVPSTVERRVLQSCGRWMDCGWTVLRSGELLAFESTTPLYSLHLLATPIGTREYTEHLEEIHRTCHKLYRGPQDQDPIFQHTCRPCSGRHGRIDGKYAALECLSADNRLDR